jgi:two-component system response regulator FlrC
VDVRWIAATNRDVEQMVGSGTFREDLYHRLAVFPIRLPPLRERPRDILPLAEWLLVRIGGELGRPGLRLHDEARQKIRRGRWPGNIRGLANALERAAILADGDVIGAQGLESTAALPKTERREPRTMAEIEEDAIRRALDEVNGNRRVAAERLGMGVRTLYDKLKRYGIE